MRSSHTLRTTTLITLLGSPSFAVVAQESLVASDMLGSTSSSLIDFSNAAPAFSSPGDAFGKLQRGVSASLPFAVADDSLIGFPTDTQGIIDENNLDEFFAIVDTVNGDTSGPVSASWTFDVGTATDLGIYLGIGAMGDFEGSDSFTITASRGGAPAETLFELVVDEAASQDYTMASGAPVTLSDPLTVGDTVLSNALTECGAAISGTGSELVITVTASADGGTEAVALQNLRIVSGFEATTACIGDSGTGEPVLQDVLISQIQGSGDSTPLDGALVGIQATVVGDFQDGVAGTSGDLNGFYVQEEPADQDADPSTSEGLFIFDPGTIVDVAPGDIVRITGTAGEFGGQTQVTADTIEIVGTTVLPAPAPVGLPEENFVDFEAVEGMLIGFTEALTISEYFNFDRFGEMVLALPRDGDDRPYQPTGLFTPGSNGYEMLRDFNAARRIILDDGRTTQNPDPSRHPNGADFTLDNRFRGGDTLSDVVGIMGEAFGAHRIQPTQGATYTALNPRPEAPKVKGDVTVAAFNVLNYFTTLDERGADDAEEFERQRTKIFAAIAEMDADVVGLIEIENNGTAILDLVGGLNSYIGKDRYTAIETGVVGTDQIMVGFIYQHKRVEPAGDFAVLDSSVDPAFNDERNRPAIAQTFERRKGKKGGDVTVIVNHLKSKGSDCDDLGDPDIGDGAGNCNLTRTSAAEALADWAAADPTGTGDNEFLIIGDLNSYREESPIAALKAAGYTDLLEAEIGDRAYTYVFNGQFGYLDYVMANAFTYANGQVRDFAVWTINADEPDLIDYDTSFKKDAQDALYAPDAYRSSDHDPVIVGIDFLDKKDCKDWDELVAPDGTPFESKKACEAVVDPKDKGKGKNKD